MLETGGGLRPRKRSKTRGRTPGLRRIGILLLPLIFMVLSGCGTPKETEFLTVSPATLTLRLGETRIFSASLGSGGSVPVTWAVSGAIGGDATHGVITEEGTYTAPPALSETNLIPNVIHVQATAEGVEGGSASVHLTTFQENQILSAEPGASFAAFRADTRSGGQSNIAVFGDRIHVVWSDNRAGTSDSSVYLQTSTDGGTTFGIPILANSATPLGNQTHPAIAVHPVSGDNYEIFVVWEDTWKEDTTGDADIYFSKSVDGGLTFSSRQRVNDDTGAVNQTTPAMAVTPDGTLYVAWEDNRNPSQTSPQQNTDIYLAVSDDGGITFPNHRVTGGEENAPQTRQVSPALAADLQGRVYLAWEDQPFLSSLNMNLVTHDEDGNVTISDPVLVASDADPDLPANTTQVHPALTVASDRGIFVVWESAKLQFTTPTSYDIYLTGSPLPDSSNELSFSPPIRVNRLGTGGLYGGWAYPAITSDENGILYLAWEDSRNGFGDQDIYATRITGDLNSDSIETARKVNDDSGTWQEKPGIAVRDGKAFVIWSDYRNNPSSTCSPQTCPNDIYSATE